MQLSMTLKNNTRVLLINNFAGGEFHFNIGKKKISTLEQHIAAGHHTKKIQDAIGLSNFQYIAVHNKGELEEKNFHFFCGKVKIQF